MTTRLKTCFALGLVLTVSTLSGAAFATEGADAKPALRPAIARGLDKANALAPALRLQQRPAARGAETDGLGRNDDDCRYGCLDH